MWDAVPGAVGYRCQMDAASAEDVTVALPHYPFTYTIYAPRSGIDVQCDECDVVLSPHDWPGYFLNLGENQRALPTAGIQIPAMENVDGDAAELTLLQACQEALTGPLHLLYGDLVLRVSPIFESD